MAVATSSGVRKAHSRHARPRPAVLKQRSFPATYSAVKPRPAKATRGRGEREDRVEGEDQDDDQRCEDRHTLIKTGGEDDNYGIHECI
ncbi:hypothetical protein EYF80_022913 [Liparis tanakae]|uniref:Uncharacterized protein n=1 Tax=Liparis tanakae TaxID=230148 RepID=A0A4Z2HPF8_9TELE|nr:hypothetical protein EYF80_022913 [Liparis tanakae]